MLSDSLFSRRLFAHTLFIGMGALLFGLFSTACFAQTTARDWDSLVGKKVVTRQGDPLGYAVDTVLDLEQGRYVGVVVASPGFLGIGSRVKIVPPGALIDGGTSRTLVLDMDKSRFKGALTFKTSRDLGPPDPVKVAEVYRYYGQQPYFSTEIAPYLSPGQTQEQLGFVQRGSQILNLPVDNLQGETLGSILGFRDLNRRTGRFKGVIIRSFHPEVDGNKIVEPEDLRYNLSFDRVRLNNRQQSFPDSPDFRFLGAGEVLEDDPKRPGEFRQVVVQGRTARDKRITEKIIKGILQSSTLSHYGKNIAVGTVNGRTVLRGRVASAADRVEIETLAAQAAGRGHVTSLVEVGNMPRSESRGETGRAASDPLDPTPARYHAL